TATLTAPPLAAPMKAPPPPLRSANTTGWDGGFILEEMIEATMAPIHEEHDPGENQRREMVQVLRRHAGGSVAIHSVAGDAVGPGFAEPLRSGFIEAGWEAGVSEMAYVKPPVGLSVSPALPTPKEAIAVSWALAAAGIHFTQQHDAKLAPEQTILVVGVG